MVVFALVAGGFALALLVLIYWRTAQRYEGLRDEVDRLQVVQRDMSSDVRTRLEEGEKVLDHVEHEIRPRLERLEPSVADLSSTLQENLPTLTEARERLEAMEGRVAEAEAEVRAALSTGKEKAEARSERIENAVRTLRNAADERLADLGARLTQLETDAAERVPSEDDDEGTQEPQLDFEVIGEDDHADDLAGAGAPVAQGAGPVALQTAGPVVLQTAGPVVPQGAGQATNEGDRGTPGEVVATADAPGGGRWVVVLLALVAGIALVITALA